MFAIVTPFKSNHYLIQFLKMHFISKNVASKSTLLSVYNYKHISIQQIVFLPSLSLISKNSIIQLVEQNLEICQYQLSQSTQLRQIIFLSQLQMRRPQYRTRQLSNQNYRRSKLSYQNIASKNTPIQKLRNNYRDTSYEQIQRQLIAPIKPPFNITSTSWGLYNTKNNQFIGFRECQQREVASLTKIMTTILSINLIDKYGLDKQIAIRISKNAAGLNGTTAQLKHGKWIRLQDLLYGAMLPSGNDAAYLLSEVMGLLLFYERMKPEDKQYADIESIDITLYENTSPFINKFIKEMNKLAREIKMYKTSFVNPHGLANALNISCAKDMIELSKYSCTNSYFMKIANTWQYECDLYNEDFQSLFDTRVWTNTNKLLKKGWQGIKTGQTPSAGSCLSSCRNGIFIVVLNCLTPDARFTQTQLLFQWYIRNCEQSFEGQEKQL